MTDPLPDAEAVIAWCEHHGGHLVPLPARTPRPPIGIIRRLLALPTAPLRWLARRPCTARPSAPSTPEES